jgi:hypothetical protein
MPSRQRTEVSPAGALGGVGGEPDSGPRLFKVHAHDDDERLLELLSKPVSPTSLSSVMAARTAPRAGMKGTSGLYLTSLDAYSMAARGSCMEHGPTMTS